MCGYYAGKPETGVITEQGDLGLGFNPISEEAVIEQLKEDKKDKED